MVRRASVVPGLAVLLAISGCHHRPVQPVLLPPQTSVPLVAVPSPETPPMVETTSPKLPAVPVADEAAHPKRTRKRSKSVAAATPAPAPPPASPKPSTDAASTATAAAKAPAPAPTKSEAIGALTVGGEQNPRTKQEASDLIAANDRRLGEMNAETARTQAPLVSKARNFQKEAQQALDSGDAEGAKNLATKGKLLLDDLDRGGATP